MVGTQQLLRRLPNEIAISFLGKEITPVSNVKDLGIILDNNLNYYQHIHQTSRSFKLQVTKTKKFEHITPALGEIKWLLVNEHLHYRDTVRTFRCVKGLAPMYLCESLRRCKSIHHHNTRNSEFLDIPQSKTKSGQRCFLHRKVKNAHARELFQLTAFYNFINFLLQCCLLFSIGNTNKVCNIM